MKWLFKFLFVRKYQLYLMQTACHLPCFLVSFLFWCICWLTWNSLQTACQSPFLIMSYTFSFLAWFSTMFSVYTPITTPQIFTQVSKRELRFPLSSLNIFDFFRSWRSLVEWTSTAPLPHVRLLSVCPLPHFLITLHSLSADSSKSHRLGKLDTVYSIVYSE